MPGQAFPPAQLGRLQAIVDAYRWGEPGRGLSAEAHAMLARLFDSERAAQAIAGMTSDADMATRILLICVKAEELSRTFEASVVAEKQALARLDVLSQAVTDLWDFVKELDSGPSNGLAAFAGLEPGEAEYHGKALGRLRGLIEGRRTVAIQTPMRLGATNKLKGGGETAAIGWLAEGILGRTGQPHTKLVATLAEVVLNIAGITEARVRGALDTRTDAAHDWKQAR